MKMEALGTGRVEKILAKTGTAAAGQEWEDRTMMVPPNGKRLYVFGLLALYIQLPLQHAFSFK